LKLNLGCNRHPIEGYVNVDIEKFEGVDQTADLEKPWPWEDESVEEILTADLPEHLRVWYEEPDPDLLEKALETDSVQFVVDALRKPKRHYGIIHFMNEAYRVLKPGGLLKLKIPSTESMAWAQDPTHVSYWNENTLLYFTNEIYRGFYPGIKAKFQPVRVGTTIKNPNNESWVQAILRK